ncbi:sarcosine oxidase / L-pipecolate oxidase protein [Dioscorea alata]|uniref:Sarcosine oxidase / L-pipecolate oxidase protein n=1 Tax=Dioscorea alata TaxID=55571 RepID=A0ACB7WIT9_DIOAL|nr:sarcosine oxidase / L-pipecolate oxidase protein [Dioscorea alata]
MGSSGGDGDGDGDYDVIVVGAGIMGSCAAYELSKRGKTTLLLEKFDFLHHLGSSHGGSRTIRATYPELYYPPMVLESFKLWEQAQSEIGYNVYTKTPQLDIGPSDNKSFLALISSCQANSIPLQFLDQSDVTKLFSGTFILPEGWTAVVSELGGVLKPTKAVAMFQSLAIRHGAVLRDRMEVLDIKKDHNFGVQVFTVSGHRFKARKCVVTVGAWTRKLVNSVTGMNLPIQPLHTSICYWKVKEGKEDLFSPEGGFPTFASYGEPYIYGTPVIEFPGLVKIALHGGSFCDPDKREWGRNSVVDSVRSWLEMVMPRFVEAGEPVISQDCMYSMTPDEDYVIDFLGGEFGEDVVVAGGFSGHGFKMGPVVGRVVAEMVVDGEVKGVEMKHFRIGRFAEDPKGNAKEHGDNQVNSL